MWGISWLAEDVLASQKGLCSMELLYAYIYIYIYIYIQRLRHRGQPEITDACVFWVFVLWLVFRFRKLWIEMWRLGQIPVTAWRLPRDLTDLMTSEEINALRGFEIKKLCFHNRRRTLQNKNKWDTGFITRARHCKIYKIAYIKMAWTYWKDE
jgi:hypothetical protein